MNCTRVADPLRHLGVKIGNAGPMANNWGCENTAGSASKYVDKVTTDDNGAIFVIMSKDSSLPTAIQGDTLSLTPYQDAGTTIKYASVGKLTIYKWLCGSTIGTPSTSSELVKYLPGSCRG